MARVRLLPAYDATSDDAFKARATATTISYCMPTRCHNDFCLLALSGDSFKCCGLTSAHKLQHRWPHFGPGTAQAALRGRLHTWTCKSQRFPMINRRYKVYLHGKLNGFGNGRHPLDR